MAILYGTTSDGNTLPAQVNALGQLVAQGVEGPAGPPGPEGPTGPAGEVEFTTGTFAPVFGSTEDGAQAITEYAVQEGYWYRFGPLLTVQVRLRTSTCIVTNARGKLTVTGFPSEALFANPSGASIYYTSGVYRLKLMGTARTANTGLQYRASAGNFMFTMYDNDTSVYALYSQLDGQVNVDNDVIFTFSGIARGAVRSIELPNDFFE
jgi:hypothetical protein